MAMRLGIPTEYTLDMGRSDGKFGLRANRWEFAFNYNGENMAVQVSHDGIETTFKMFHWDLGDRLEVITREMLNQRIQDAIDNDDTYDGKTIEVAETAGYEAIMADVRARWTAICYIVNPRYAY